MVFLRKFSSVEFSGDVVVSLIGKVRIFVGGFCKSHV